jgi:hypothetical protein
MAGLKISAESRDTHTHILRKTSRVQAVAKILDLLIFQSYEFFQSCNLLFENLNEMTKISPVCRRIILSPQPVPRWFRAFPGFESPSQPEVRYPHLVAFADQTFCIHSIGTVRTQFVPQSSTPPPQSESRRTRSPMEHWESQRMQVAHVLEALHITNNNKTFLHRTFKLQKRARRACSDWRRRRHTRCDHLGRRGWRGLAGATQCRRGQR